MRKSFFVPVIILLFACSCSSGSNQEKQSTEQEEAEIVESITAELDAAQETLKKETEENITEIDSLLENF